MAVSQWIETSEDTLVQDAQVIARTDEHAVPGGVLYRTIVRVRKGPEVVAVSVATTFVPAEPNPRGLRS